MFVLDARICWFFEIINVNIIYSKTLTYGNFPEFCEISSPKGIVSSISGCGSW